MTRGEVCRLIAEKLESNPVWSKWMHDQSWNISDGGHWAGYRDDPADDTESIERHPVSYYQSEDASARLLEAMPSVYLVHFYVTGEWECAADKWYSSTSYCFAKDRKTAIVLAACKWLGIEVREGGE